jgi:HD-GYP domain-containing protein (c-di-GMP phosphodiesterase class II)
MLKREDFIHLPKELLREGVKLTVDIFVLFPQSKTIGQFKHQGDHLTAMDLKTLANISPENLVFPKKDAQALYRMGEAVFEIELTETTLQSPSLKASAAAILSTLGGADIAQNLEHVGAMVQNLISTFKKTPAVIAYDEALRLAEEKSHDPLTKHHLQVSSISVLMAITIGDFSMDDLSDLAAAGLMHDLGLKSVTHTLIQSHLQGQEQLSPSEKIIYMRHPDLSFDQIKKDKIKITPGISRIIEMHHEHYNGTGFHSVAGPKIYRPARVLRIADDLVSLIQDRKMNLGFKLAIEMLDKRIGIYDPEMMRTILAATTASSRMEVPQW